NIIENDHAPFIFSTNSVEAYVPTVYFGMMAQNMGYENYYNFMTLNGEIKSKTGEVEATLTTATGISAWDTQTVQNAYQASLEFFNRTIIGNVGSINGEQYLPDQMLHKSCVSSISLSHLDAQDNFISAYQSSNIGYSAFLLEGTWWENEAKSAFNELPNDDNGESRKFGEREYRYYLYPTTSTQVTGADKSVLACQDDGCGVLFNNVPAKLKEGITAEDFIQKCKEFLAYTLSDKSLEYYTASTGNPRPFEYDISAENLAKMTPFQRNNLQIIQDTEHISIVYPNIINNVNPIRTFGGFDNYQINSSVKTPWAALKRAQDNPLTVSEYITRITSYAKSNYSSCYDKIKEYVNE
ncbi:MAG: hypothetical protein IKA88_06355, partial [Clostridia bacterium]|nr:hypothetical protein [Clostridia bacterium]